MLTITDGEGISRALKLPIDPRLKRLLIERRDQFGGDIKDQVRFIIAESQDTLEAVEEVLGFVGLSDPEHSFGCEWVANHSGIYEAVWILADDGYAHVVLASKQDADPELLKLCEMYVTDKG